MQDRGIIKVISGIAGDLLRRQAKQEQIDGRFLFEVWDDAWIGRVKETRQTLFGQTEPPFSKAALKEPEQSVNEDLDRAVTTLSKETGLWSTDVRDHLLAGSPIALPRMAIISDSSGIDELPFGLKQRPRVAVLVYSEDVSGQELASWYRSHLAHTRPHLLGEKPMRRSQPSQERHNLVRTWGVMCLEKKAQMTARRAIAMWNEHFSRNPYGQPEEPCAENLPTDKTTSSAEGQYSRDKRRLLERLNLTC